MAILYDQFGREIQLTKTPERRPLATAPVLDSWREYVCSGLTPGVLTTLLQEADAGDVRRQAELFEQMEEKDAHLLGEAEKRRNAILDVDFEIQPATEDGRDVKVADFVREYLDNMGDWDDTVVSLQDSVGKGFSCLEIHWDVSGGQAMPSRLEFIEQKRFLFMDSAGYLRKYPKLLSDANTMGDEVPPWKMLFHCYGGKAGHATRSGIYRVCAWMFLFRNYSIKDWMGFIEIFGMPLRLGKYSSGASESDKDALITAIQSLGSDAAGIISKETEIEFIEAVKSGTRGDNPYLAMAEFAAKEMSKALLGQTLTADVGDKGSYAAAKTHNEVRLDLAKADTRSVAATIRHQLIRPLVGFNFGWDTATPGYAAVWKEREDLKNLSETYKNVLGFGQPVSAEHVSNRFAIPLPQEGDTILEPMSFGPVVARRSQSPKNERSARVAGKETRPDEIVDPGQDYDADQQEIEDLAEDSLDHADRAWRGIDAPVRRLIASCSSLEEVRDRIFDLYADLNSKDLEQLMRDALGTAALAGAGDAAKGTRRQR
jgi:phage gp29-like protein